MVILYYTIVIKQTTKKLELHTHLTFTQKPNLIVTKYSLQNVGKLYLPLRDSRALPVRTNLKK